MVAIYTASAIRKSRFHFENTCHNFMHVLSQEQHALIKVPDCANKYDMVLWTRAKKYEMPFRLIETR